MNTNIPLNWPDFKSTIDNNNLRFQEIILDGNYLLYADNGNLDITCSISKKDIVIPGSDQEDYENNYQSQAINRVGQRTYTDDDRLKVTNFKDSTISQKFSVETSTTNLSLPGSSFETVFSYTGSGLLYGFNIDTDSDKTIIRVILDSVNSFNINLKELKDMGFENNSIPQQSGSFFVMPKNSQLDFSPPKPISFDSSFEIQAKTSDDKAFNIKRYMFLFTKES